MRQKNVFFYKNQNKKDFTRKHIILLKFGFLNFPFKKCYHQKIVNKYYITK